MYFCDYKQEQKDLIRTLKLHVFGSEENYINFRNSEKDFPRDYKDTKRLIENETFDSEFLKEIISHCHKIVYTIESSTNKTPVGKGSSNGKVHGVDKKVYIKDDSNHIGGNQGMKTKQDAKLERTFKHCLGTYVSIRRRANWSDVEILEAVKIYTNNYNEKHGTSFVPYVPKRKEKA